jgi:hypothetical protein
MIGSQVTLSLEVLKSINGRTTIDAIGYAVIIHQLE